MPDCHRRYREEAFLRTAVIISKRFGPIEYEDLTVFDRRIPAPPKSMTGNIRCMYGSAEIIGDLAEDQGITSDLTDEDIKLLRVATRKAFLRAGGEPLSDEECDSFINKLGPEVIKDEITG